MNGVPTVRKHLKALVNFPTPVGCLIPTSVGCLISNFGWWSHFTCQFSDSGQLSHSLVQLVLCFFHFPLCFFFPCVGLLLFSIFLHYFCCLIMGCMIFIHCFSKTFAVCNLLCMFIYLYTISWNLASMICSCSLSSTETLFLEQSYCNPTVRLLFTLSWRHYDFVSRSLSSHH